MRQRAKPWADQELDTNPLYIENPYSRAGRWREVFSNDNPIHLEIGCGKGRFVVESALANPHVNFVAMEKQEQIICMALRHASIVGLPQNLRFLCQDAEELADFFANSPENAELSRIYINFCDPWRARGKWRKRRLTHRNFLAVYKNLMGDAGEVFFKTDDAGLFRFSVAEFEETGWLLSNVTFNLHSSGFGGNIMTEYEERFAAGGKPICRLEARAAVPLLGEGRE